MDSGLLDRIADGRTDLVHEHLTAGGAATDADANGVPLIRWCAYYGDASAVRVLVDRGASLSTLGENLGLNEAAFHGHWRLCELLIDSGADPNRGLADTGETPLHLAVSSSRLSATPVVRVLVLRGAEPNAATVPGVETGAFMRDVRTKGETPLHRAAAFAGEEAIGLLLAAGARREARDAHGDTPLSWASWHLRPDAILRLLCFGNFSIRPDRRPMEVYLLGGPRAREGAKR